MKIALHTISYSGSWGQASLPLEKIIERTAQLGYDGLMLAARRPHASPLDFNSEARKNLRAKMEEHGIALTCLAGYTNFTADAEHTEVPHREMQIYYVAELCRLATDLGGKIVRIFTGYEHPALPYSRAWDLTVAAKLLAPVTVYTTIADYVRIPRFRYQPELVNYAPQPDYIQAVPMGEGFINYTAFLKSLCENGYTGPVAYEMCSPLRDGGSLETLDQYARQFVEFMRPWRAPQTGSPATPVHNGVDLSNPTGERVT